MSDDDRVATTIAHLFIEAVDKNRDRLKMCLHEDAMLNWFGRTLAGSEEIISFLNSMVPHTIHYVHHAVSCAPRTTRATDENNNQTVDATLIDNHPMETDGKPVKRPSSSIDNPTDKVANLVNMLAGIEEVNIASRFRGLSTKMLKQTPYLGFNLIVLDSEDKEKPNTINKGIIIKANLYLQSRNRIALWERKIEHIYLEYIDSCIVTIIYKGASNCRKNLSKLFMDM